MEKKEIEMLTKEQVNDELFREINCSWDKKDLIIYIIENLESKEKVNWIKQWFEIE